MNDDDDDSPDESVPHTEEHRRVLSFQACEDPALHSAGPQGESTDQFYLMVRQQISAAEAHLRRARHMLEAGVATGVLRPDDVRGLQSGVRLAAGATMQLQTDILTMQAGFFTRMDA